MSLSDPNVESTHSSALLLSYWGISAYLDSGPVKNTTENVVILAAFPLRDTSKLSMRLR